METILKLLPFVLPPLLGAVIGYVTNALAIRMLFRPLTERRFLGMRVPLTPGIIPRQRHQLAHSIARMVSTKLLTEEVLIARLHDPEFTRVLETSVGRFTADILDGGVGAEGSDGTTAETRDAVAEIAQGVLTSFFRSPGFLEIVHRLAETVADGTLAMEMDRVLPEAAQLSGLVDGAIVSLTTGPVAPTAELAVQRWVRSHMGNDTPLVAILGEGSIERLAGVIPGVYDPVLEALVAFLKQPATRRELAFHGQALLSRVLKRLNLFQRFIVSATQYDRNLNENMPAVIDDLIESVERAGRQRQNRERLIRSLQDQVHELGSTGIRTLLERFDLHAERLVTRLFALAVELLSRADVRSGISEGIARFVDKHRDESLGEVAGSLFGLESEELSRRVVALADSWIEREGNADRVAERVTEFIVRYFGRSERKALGELLPLTDTQKRGVDRFLARRLEALVERRVPEIIAGIDVYSMVVEKIDALDVESVEQLLLMVIARHLKWINLFGALLGSLIGGTQVLIGLIT